MRLCVAAQQIFFQKGRRDRDEDTKERMALILSVALVLTMIPAGASFVYAN